MRPSPDVVAVRAGANVKAVQRMLGHASAGTTLDVYAGFFNDDLGAVANRQDAAATARADHLRTTAPKDDVPPFDLGGRNAS